MDYELPALYEVHDNNNDIQLLQTNLIKDLMFNRLRRPITLNITGCFNQTVEVKCDNVISYTMFNKFLLDSHVVKNNCHYDFVLKT